MARRKYKNRARGAHVVKVGKVWYADYTDPLSKRRIYRSLRTQSKEEAERIVAERLYKRRRIAEGIDKPMPERTLGEPGQCADALRRASGPLFETAGTTGGGPVEPSAEMLERLRALGYAH